MDEEQKKQKFYDYFEDWYEVFKKDTIRPITAKKYVEAQAEIKALAPDLTMGGVDRMQIQKLIIAYGKKHEESTAKGFFHMVRACLQNAQYDGLIKKDPTFKLKATSQKKHKVTRAMYLEKEQADRLAQVLEKDSSVESDMFDFDLRTGLRFAELLGITPKDINREKQTITVNKSWLYKQGKQADFGETKNKFSHREIPIDDTALSDIDRYSFRCSESEPIFVKALSDEKGFKPTKDQKYMAIYNGSLNRKLTKFCKKAKVPRIGIHGLRHTHASLLLLDDRISILSISKRLGHANTTTTEKVYLHLIQDRKEKDNKEMFKILNNLGKSSNDSNSQTK